MKNLNVGWRDVVWEIPLRMLFLWARQNQYTMDDTVMTLGDKEMIDNMEKSRKG